MVLFVSRSLWRRLDCGTLLSSHVNFPMLEVIRPDPEALATVSADVGLLSRVQCGVNLEVPWCLKGLAADTTGEFALRVHVLTVAIHAARAPESLTAIGADYGTVTRVLSHVHLQSVLMYESIITITNCR